LLPHPSINPNATGGTKAESSLHFAARDGSIDIVSALLACPSIDARTANRSRVMPRATALASKTAASADIAKMLQDWEKQHPRAPVIPVRRPSGTQ